MAPNLVPIKDRFWTKVKKMDGGCWLWTGAISNGYGEIRRSGKRKKVLAHRWAYESLVGPVPNGLCLDHLCRVRNCVNPSHLEAVTLGENTLRGVGLSAINRNKTHCSKGHPFSKDNTRMYKSDRVCIACQKINHLKYRTRKRADEEGL